MNDRLANLDHAFNARSIAFVGATETQTKWGFLILNNLLTGGYEGDIYPVNPGRDTILGIKAYPSVRDIPGDVDLVIFTVPARLVINALDDCIAKGIRAGVVISAGFKELGGENAAVEAEMVKKAHDAGMVMVGPNCQGICCPSNKLYPWMPILYHPPAGRVGFVSQSGNILNMLVGHISGSGFGVSKAVSSGNEADLKTEDYYTYFLNDPDTDVIVSYIEGICNGRDFITKARSTALKKPIIAIKGGRTSSGMSAAASHTGAMAVSEDLFEAACRQAGIVLTRSIEEAGITAASFVNRPLPRGKRVGVVTGGGGLGVIAADVCSELGLDIVELSPQTLDAIHKHMPDWWVPGNPVDLVAGLDFTIIKPVIEILMKNGEVDAVMFLWIDAPHREGTVDTRGGGVDISGVWEMIRLHFRNYAAELYAIMQELQVPLYVASNVRATDIANADDPEGGDLLMVYNSVESACRAIKSMADYYRFRSSLR
ncbi:MAG: CoA-binding protein [Actinomycetota bacterium]|nr:CoA-binding protein [Actinomycetota bacterium]